jgi:ABC-type antimicrobial peptide transport system permease subunit
MKSAGPDVSYAMLMSYIKIAFRKMRRQKGYTFINICGLGIGLACCVIMILWISSEMSFDSFHENRNSIFRLIKETRVNGSEILDARIPFPLAESILAKIPEVKNYTRYQGVDGWKITSGEKSFYNDFLSTADSTFFEVFTFRFIEGDPKNALKNRSSIVITESMARKYFGTEEPMGKVLSIIQPGFTFTVTGIIRDVPENSHLHFDCIIPIVNFWEWWDGRESGWNMNMFYTYILLQPNSSAASVGTKIASVMNENVPQQKSGIRMQPLMDVHLRSSFGWDLDNYKQGSSTVITVFILAALGVLILAIINFINIATARSANRAKEIGLRKINGSRRFEIIMQFIGESVLISLFALLLALAFVYFGLPLFNSLADRQIGFGSVFEPGLFLTLLAVTFLTGILAGSFPAFFLSSFRPVRVLKGDWISAGQNKALLRRILVVVQFAITIFLISISVIVNKQLKYLRSKDLGMETANIAIVFNMGIRNYESLKNSIQSNPDILNFTFSDPPGIDQRGISNVVWEGKDPATTIEFYPVSVDPGYLPTFRIRMSGGRFFSEEFTADGTESVIINETAARRMAMDSPVGKKLTIGNKSYNIIGVINDFHQTTLRKSIEPMILKMNHESPQLCLSINPLRKKEAIAYIENTLKSFNIDPERPIRYEFLDERIEKFYISDKKIEVILSVFRAIALFTACLGLLGLSSYIAEKRNKEIGLRKVFGGSVSGMVWLQVREFSKLILISGVIAGPLAYLAANKWLTRSAYHFNPGIGVILGTVAITLAIALLTVAYQSLKAALTNPVDTLRHE